MGKTFVVGDIHGNYKGFKQALERSKFDYNNDNLISLGDVVDGHCNSFEVIEELLKIKNLVPIRGNHDDWFHTWILTGRNPTNWMQGQKATGESYLEQEYGPDDKFLYDYSTGHAKVRVNNLHIPKTHQEFFNNQLPYYIDDNNNLFIHGGFDRNEKLSEQDPQEFYWNRELWKQALSWQKMIDKKPKVPSYIPSFNMVEDFNEIYIGHTSTQFWDVNTPMKAANITNLDTGGGWYGYVTIMDINTKEFWQSDDGKSLYPEFRGR